VLSRYRNWWGNDGETLETAKEIFELMKKKNMSCAQASDCLERVQNLINRSALNDGAMDCPDAHLKENEKNSHPGSH
jgi:hypothetical protein